MNIAKHYFGYSDPKSGKDRTPAWVIIIHYHYTPIIKIINFHLQIPKRFLLQYFVRPFAAAFNEGVATIMVNSGEVQNYLI